MSNINYTKLNDKIVQQAYSHAGLTTDQVAELYEAKIARAQALLEARLAKTEASRVVFHRIEE